MDIMKTIRREIEKSSVSQAEIARQAGLNKTALHRTMVKNGTLNSKSCNKLLSFFGYELKKKAGR